MMTQSVNATIPLFSISPLTMAAVPSMQIIVVFSRGFVIDLSPLLSIAWSIDLYDVITTCIIPITHIVPEKWNEIL